MVLRPRGGPRTSERPAPLERSWVALQCAHYRVAIAAASVVSVNQDVVLNGDIVDLVRRWTGRARDRAPYAVWVQNLDATVTLGVDRVLHVKSTEPIQAIPTFGLEASGLFSAVVMLGRDPYLVLDTKALFARLGTPNDPYSHANC